MTMSESTPDGQWHARLAHQLEQLYLVRASLLPGESFAFLLPPEDVATWTRLLLDAGPGMTHGDSEAHSAAGLTQPPCPARFEVRGARGVEPWFEVTLPACTRSTGDDLARDVHVHVHDDTHDDDNANDDAASIMTRMSTASVDVDVTVKGDRLDRATQAWWQTQIRARIDAVTATTCSTTGDSDAEAGCPPVYDLVTELLALLQSQPQPCSSAIPSSSTPAPQSHPTPAPTPTPYHALLTSHHLISPTKRRALAALAHAHALTTGFAKLGYPGIIYAQGTRDAVETFVSEVKRWQWLALRVRCVEPVPSSGCFHSPERWIEMTKVGEVVDWMRKRGMESLVTDLGIGAPSKASKP